MSTEAHSVTDAIGRQPTGESRYFQTIDLHTERPAELEQVLDRWRSVSLEREHIADVVVRRDDADAGHLVLQVEYEPQGAEDESCEQLQAATAEAAAVVGLLDAPPRFRPC